MLQLLYGVIFGEMFLILTLLFKSPLRKLVILALDKMKRGKGPVMVKTVAGTVFVVLLAGVYNLVDIKNRTIESGVLNPTDEVLMSVKMLEISLMGIFLKLLRLVFENWNLAYIYCESSFSSSCSSVF